jgi:hypothetical protein
MKGNLHVRFCNGGGSGDTSAYRNPRAFLPGRSQYSDYRKRRHHCLYCYRLLRRNRLTRASDSDEQADYTVTAALARQLLCAQVDGQYY